MKRIGRDEGRHGQAKLTPNDVITVRRMRGDGVSQTEIARRFGVSIPRIVNGRGWKAVA